MSGTVIGAGDMVMSKTEMIALPSQRLFLQSGRTDNKEQNNSDSQSASKCFEGDEMGK